MTHIETGLRLKIAKMGIDDISVPIGGPFLDIPVFIKDVRGDIQLRVQHLIVIDGISLRKLALGSDIRSMLTVKGLGKISTKGKKNLVSEYGKDVSDITLDIVGAGFIKPLFYHALNGAKRQLSRERHDNEGDFSARLTREGDQLGELRFKIKKWNKYGGTRHIEDFGLDIEALQGKSVLRIDQVLRLEGIASPEVVIRTNIPISGLNRDHAKPINLLLSTNVEGNHIEEPERFQSRLTLPPIKYTTLLSADGTKV